MSIRLGAAICLALLWVAPASARFQTVIPNIVAADSLLEVGLADFKAGNYTDAQAAFDQILSRYPTNSASSSAAILAAKSAYRLGQYQQARSFLSGFAATYGSSSYVTEARNLDEMAFEAIRFGTESTLTLGVLFSLDRNERHQTQEIFNGIRLAVDAHNAQRNSSPVKMIFRDIDGGSASARRAVRELADQNVSAIIGTLFSEEAIAAAQEAERLKTVFVAPLATDDNLTTNRSFTFQANPSMAIRGASMARFAVNGLRLDSFAVVLSVDERKISERQADGFLEEASRLGAVINQIHILPDENALYRLAEVIPSDTLDAAHAVYIPLASRNPVATVGAILSNLDRMNRDVRVIGNEAWQDLPQKTHASAYLTTYGDEFWVDAESVEYQRFVRSFRALSDTVPERLGVTGFDVTNFVLDSLEEANGENGAALAKIMRNSDPFQGLGLRIHFDGGSINKALFYHRYRDNQLSLIR
jgi:branched-chain amino acid transport system substrate-binding protein